LESKLLIGGSRTPVYHAGIYYPSRAFGAVSPAPDADHQHRNSPMTRTAFVAGLALALGACRGYDLYPRITGQKGLVPADQYAAYGREQAEEVAIGRAFAQAHAGDSPAALASQAAAAVAYARSLPDVADVTADTLGQRLTVRFRSGWRVAVLPIPDGKGPNETPNLPPGAGAPAGK
jgi:hypothetical protein